MKKTIDSKLSTYNTIFKSDFYISSSSFQGDYDPCNIMDGLPLIWSHSIGYCVFTEALAPLWCDFRNDWKASVLNQYLPLMSTWKKVEGRGVNWEEPWQQLILQIDLSYPWLCKKVFLLKGKTIEREAVSKTLRDIDTLTRPREFMKQCCSNGSVFRDMLPLKQSNKYDTPYHLYKPNICWPHERYDYVLHL